MIAQPIKQPTKIVTTPVSFTEAERNRLTDAAAELARLDALLAEACDIRPALQNAAADFALGKISIREAIGLLQGANDSIKRGEIESTLRRPIKSLIKQTVGNAADLISKARNHHVAELAARASTVEKRERADLAELGIADDDFQPSDLLEGIREQHRRALADSAGAPTRPELSELLSRL